MTDLTTLHKNARSLILSLREGLETLEKADEQASTSAPSCLAPSLLASKPGVQLTKSVSRCPNMPSPQVWHGTWRRSWQTCRSALCLCLSNIPVWESGLGLCDNQRYQA